MPRWEPMHRDFDRALRILAGFDVSYAEAWRLLATTAARLDLPRPSYWRVRRFLLRERRRRELAREMVEPVISDLIAGLVPVWRLRW